MAKSVYLTVNDFAKLHDVNKRTLHYYDSIGIFQPQKVGKNGYRYYTYMQGAEFEIILALRELGMSIEEIREYKKTRSADELSKLFLEKTNEIDEKIIQLKELKKVLNQKRENLLKAQSGDLDKIEKIYCKTEYLAITDLSSAKQDEDVGVKVYSSLAKCRSGEKNVRAFNSGYGSMIECDKLLAGEFERYRYLFVTIPKPQNKNELFKKTEGTYLRAYCKGEWDKIPATYEKIISYAGEQHLKLVGYAYEEGINEIGLTSENAANEYVTQITVQCEPEI